MGTIGECGAADKDAALDEPGLGPLDNDVGVTRARPRLWLRAELCELSAMCSSSRNASGSTREDEDDWRSDPSRENWGRRGLPDARFCSEESLSDSLVRSDALPEP